MDVPGNIQPKGGKGETPGPLEPSGGVRAPGSVGGRERRLRRAR